MGVIDYSLCDIWAFIKIPWWRHQMETFSALLALCSGNSPVPGEFLIQRPVTRSFDVLFHLCLNKRLSKQSRGWWFETPSRSLWRHFNAMTWELNKFWIYYRDVTRTLRRLKSPATELFVQHIVRHNTKENIKAPLCCSIVRVIHRWSLVALTKDQ